MKFDFKLVSSGWLHTNIEIEDININDTVSYLSNPIGDLVDNLIKMLECYNGGMYTPGEIITFDWELEPSCFEWAMNKSDKETLHVKIIYHEDACNKYAEGMETEPLIDTSVNFNEFIDAVVKGIDKLLKTNGILSYDQIWHDRSFPIANFLRLKYYVLNKKAPSGKEFEKRTLHDDFELLMKEI